MMIWIWNEVHDRSQAVLLRHVTPGTHIISDRTASYKRLSEYGYVNGFVVHGKEYMNSEDMAVHTQNMEIRNRWTKAAIKTYKSNRPLNAYCAEYSYNCTIDVYVSLVTRDAWYNFHVWMFRKFRDFFYQTVLTICLTVRQDLHLSQSGWLLPVSRYSQLEQATVIAVEPGILWAMERTVFRNLVLTNDQKLWSNLSRLTLINFHDCADIWLFIQR